MPGPDRSVNLLLVYMFAIRSRMQQAIDDCAMQTRKGLAKSHLFLGLSLQLLVFSLYSFTTVTLIHRCMYVYIWDFTAGLRPSVPCVPLVDVSFYHNFKIRYSSTNTKDQQTICLTYNIFKKVKKYLSQRKEKIS